MYICNYISMYICSYVDMLHEFIKYIPGKGEYYNSTYIPAGARTNEIGNMQCVLLMLLL